MKQLLLTILATGLFAATTRAGDLTPEEQALVDKGATMEMYSPKEHSRHFINHIGRVLAPGLILLDPKLPVHLRRRNPLATAWRQLDGALDDFTNRQLLAA
jgi:hypothetical protein